MAFQEFNVEGGGFGGGGGRSGRYELVAYEPRAFERQIAEMKDFGQVSVAVETSMKLYVDSFDPLAPNFGQNFSFVQIIDTQCGEEMFDQYAYGDLIKWEEGMRVIEQLERAYGIDIPMIPSPYGRMLRMRNGDVFPITPDITALISTNPAGKHEVAWVRPDMRGVNLRIGHP